MTSFDLKDRYRWPGRLRRDRAGPPAEAAERESWSILTGWIASVALCLALAALSPAPAMPWVLAGLLSLAGFVWLGAAITRAGPPANATHLTAWDAALLAFAASFGVQSAGRLGLLGT
ncbi:hypothetical protein [Methylobacterium sp. J-077]|uniref:hypothetical protein n=1 Tax=Methylobacterium sp. J-077 TaxID=2836656 RepID=UPI001FBA120E|nr:hypothetical protein [Methylobacterium sp. J-077]MCJ2125509.1 hypothetical protein [Methylobacterium sp. J-077]